MKENASVASMNIFQKLAAVRGLCMVIQKNKSGYGYKYVTEDEILSRVTSGMTKYNLSLIPSIRSGTSVVTPINYTKTKATKDGKIFEEQVNEVVMSAEMVFTWVNNDNPAERVEVPWVLVGQQADASRCFGSGLTYANRYFLLKYFQVATVDDDPDNFRAKQRKAEEEQEAAMAAEIVKEIDVAVKAYVAEHPDKRDDVIKLIKSHIKSPDYNKIRDTATAARLNNDIMKMVTRKE